MWAVVLSDKPICNTFCVPMQVKRSLIEHSVVLTDELLSYGLWAWGSHGVDHQESFLVFEAKTSSATLDRTACSRRTLCMFLSSSEWMICHKRCCFSKASGDFYFSLSRNGYLYPISWNKKKHQHQTWSVCIQMQCIFFTINIFKVVSF